MKKIIIVPAIMICFISSCQSPKGNKLSVEEYQDSALVEEYQDSVPVDYAELDGNQTIVDNFFKNFQEKNDGWTKTEKGHKKLVAAFKKKITTDIEFAKACASYNTSLEYDNSIANSESISSYNKEDGEEGEIKAFDFVIDVQLIKPLYNGQKTISVKYEIISTIPSTVEEHWKPYIKNVNYCSTFDSFLKNSYDGTLNLGCYIVTNKQ